MSIFEDVKAAVNIRQVVEFYGYKVNRAGQFSCPFHNDSHPSASIKNDYFNCFVCGAGGDAITFTARLFHISNMEACKRLIADFKLPINTDPPRDKMAAINTDPPRDKMAAIKADRERKKWLQQKREAEQMAELIRHTGDVLADFHRIAWQYTQLTPDDPRYAKGLQDLPIAEYYLTCYDADPRAFSIEARKWVKEIEKRIY